MARFDFEQQGIEGWKTVDGQWVVEEMHGAPSAQRVLVQRATANACNAIVASPGPYTDSDVSVCFKPMADRDDASRGIVLRCAEGHDSLVRANALENSFRLYAYEHGWYQWTTARVQTPALGPCHVDPGGDGEGAHPGVSMARSSWSIGRRVMVPASSACGPKPTP